MEIVSLQSVVRDTLPLIPELKKSLASLLFYTQNQVDITHESKALAMDQELEAVKSEAAQIESLPGTKESTESASKPLSNGWCRMSKSEWKPTAIGCAPGGGVPTLDIPQECLSTIWAVPVIESEQVVQDDFAPQIPETKPTKKPVINLFSVGLL